MDASRSENSHEARRVDDALWLLRHGDLVGSSELIEPQIAAQSVDAQTWALWAELCRMRGRIDVAKQATNRALELDPCNGWAFVERSRVLLAQGDVAGALDCFEQAFDAGHAQGEWMREWVVLLWKQRDYERASEVALAYCENQPKHAQAWFILGYSLEQSGHLPSAVQAYQRCRKLDGQFPSVNTSLARVFLEMGDFPSASFHIEEAIVDEPESAIAWFTLARVYQSRGHTESAEIAIERSLALAPDCADSLLLHAQILREAGRWSEADALIERAAELAPADGAIRFAQAQGQLSRGDFARGWLNYEWRGRTQLSGPRGERLPLARWNGEDLRGKTVLVWCDQGLAESIAFSRFVPSLARDLRCREAQVALSCPTALHGWMLAMLGAHVSVLSAGTETLEHFDFHLPLGSVPLYLDIGIEDIGSALEVLYADGRAPYMALKATAGPLPLRVGLNWLSADGAHCDHHASIDPHTCGAALAGLTDIAFHALPRGAGADIHALHQSGLPILDHTKTFDSVQRCAHYLRGLDLVVTVSGPIAHLAASMGVPTWLMLNTNPSWIWMTQRDDSPWYPAMRLYRQARAGDWSSVLQRVRADLQGMRPGTQV
ncbi:tetratricopeptide repeat protein [Burkholderia seminalis]|uniref:tetratricopeptide repeat protein n=1 Tax=Burkholderia seminalis TaxID=488731 RepID=UPI001454ABEC|nr:tetratricopeptide repeat protein [Burkholderia seminalis]MCA8306869.1 tetratricopeptide repeat protein [Burkholderia seminalis]MCA8435477.1 tetratricopeptide repeat protein [Burkholderia seminalis]VWC42966.1 TPR domain-containing protein [Burkholderia seminalis]